MMHRVDVDVARVEGGGELFERMLLACAVGTFEDDQCAAAVSNLRQLELAQLLAQSG
jgi:hypothetical protein